MLRDIDKKSNEEIKPDYNSSRFTEEKVTNIFKALKITESLSEFNFIKKSGYSVKLVLSWLLVMVVTGKKNGIFVLTHFIGTGNKYRKGCILPSEEQRASVLASDIVAYSNEIHWYNHLHHPCGRNGQASLPDF